MIHGSIKFPGDKSISHRALMIASLSPEASQIKNLSNGDDVKSTKRCLKQCGININEYPGNLTSINGNTFSDPKDDLDCGNSGTTVRLLSGLLGGQKINARLIGDISLSKRPMNRIVDPLSKMKVIINSSNGRMILNGWAASQGAGGGYQAGSSQVSIAWIVVYASSFTGTPYVP